MNLWYGGRLVISAEIPRDEMQTLVEISTTVYDAINFFLFQLDELDDFQVPFIPFTSFFFLFDFIFFLYFFFSICTLSWCSSICAF